MFFYIKEKEWLFSIIYKYYYLNKHKFISNGECYIPSLTYSPNIDIHNLYIISYNKTIKKIVKFTFLHNNKYYY